MTRFLASERNKLLLSLVLIGACVAVAVVFRAQALHVDTPAHAKEGDGGRAAQPVWFINPRRDNIRRTVSMHADIKPDREAAIYGKVAGYVLPHPVEVGTRVDPTGKDGATKVLLRLAVPDLDARVVTARSEVARATAAVTQAGSAVAQARAGVAEAAQGVAEAQALARQAQGMIRGAEAAVVESQAEFDLKDTLYQRLAKVVAESPNLVAQDQVDQAQGAVAIAKAKLHVSRIGIEKARDDAVVAQARVAAAEARAQAAEAQVTAAEAAVVAAQAQEKLAASKATEAVTLQGFATLHAPFAGVVAERMVDTGELVKDGSRNSGAMPLFRIVADDKLRLAFYISEPDAPMCVVGSKVEIRVDVIKGPKGEAKTFETTVTRIADALDPKTHTMEVEAEFANPRDEDGRKMLRSDMFARAKVFLEERKGTLIVPARCVLTKKRKSKVMVVQEDGTVKAVGIKIGIDDGVRVEVLEGLDEGSRVIVRGGNLVAEGERVVPTQADASVWKDGE